MLHKDLPHKIHVGQRPIFHGPAILLYILKTIGWRKLILVVMHNQWDRKTDLIKYI